jgi:hypothetical protein
MGIFHGKHECIPLSRVPLFRPLLYILYGIEKNYKGSIPPYSKIPYLTEIAQTIGKPEGLSAINRKTIPFFQNLIKIAKIFWYSII